MTSLRRPRACDAVCTAARPAQVWNGGYITLMNVSASGGRFSLFGVLLLFGPVVCSRGTGLQAQPAVVRRTRNRLLSCCLPTLHPALPCPGAENNRSLDVTTKTLAAPTPAVLEAGHSAPFYSGIISLTASAGGWGRWVGPGDFGGWATIGAEPLLCAVQTKQSGPAARSRPHKRRWSHVQCGRCAEMVPNPVLGS